MITVRRLTYDVLEALACIDKSKTYNEIADDLGVGRATFARHLKSLVITEHVIVKSGRPNRYEITAIGRKALEHGYRRRA